MDKQSALEIETQLNQIYEPLELKAAQLAFDLNGETKIDTYILAPSAC